VSHRVISGDDGVRTRDLVVANHALSQLSYIPSSEGSFLISDLRLLTPELGVLGFEPRTSALSELRSSQLSYTPFVGWVRHSCLTARRECLAHFPIKQKSQTLQRFGPIRQRDGIERQPSSFPERIRLVISLITCEEQKADPGWDFERVVIIRRSEKVSTQKNDLPDS
jgi:hypothetical protein